MAVMIVDVFNALISGLGLQVEGGVTALPQRASLRGGHGGQAARTSLSLQVRTSPGLSRLSYGGGCC